MRTNQPKSPNSLAAQRKSNGAPFFHPEERRKGFFDSNSGQKPFFHSSSNLIQMEPGECELPKIGSKDFAKEVDALKKSGQITEAHDENLMEKYGASREVSRCVRARVIHDLKTTKKKTPGLVPAIPAPVSPSSVDTPASPGRQVTSPIAAPGALVVPPGNDDAAYQTWGSGNKNIETISYGRYNN